MNISDSETLKDLYQSVIDQILDWEQMENCLKADRKLFPELSKAQLIEQYKSMANLDIPAKELAFCLAQDFSNKLKEYREIESKYFSIKDELEFFEQKLQKRFLDDIVDQLSNNREKALERLSKIDF